jgi:hypothetical protein
MRHKPLMLRSAAALLQGAACHAAQNARDGAEGIRFGASFFEWLTAAIPIDASF